MLLPTRYCELSEKVVGVASLVYISAVTPEHNANTRQPVINSSACAVQLFQPLQPPVRNLQGQQ